MSQKNVILSPHLDDAVFSCWHQIDKPNSQVLTIFAGTPNDETPSEWDLSLGYTNARAAMKLRLRENDEALQNTGAEVINLDYLDLPYRSSPQSVVGIADKIDNFAPRNALIIAPLGMRGIGRSHTHEDHIIIRQVAQILIERGRRVEFYADLPYMMPIINLRNWPRYISKKKIEHELGMKVGIEISELSSEQQLKKQIACKAYKTQFKAFGAFQKTGAYRWEVIVRPK